MAIIKIIKRHWYQGLGLLVFLYLIIFKVDIYNIGLALKEANSKPIIFAILLSLLMIATQAWRWNYLKKIQQINYSFLKSLAMFGEGVFWGVATPGRLGDLSKIGMLANRGYSWGRASLSVIVDRLADALFLLVIGYLGLIFLAKNFWPQIAAITGLIISAIILFLGFKNKKMEILTKKLLLSFIPQNYKKNLATNYQELKNDFKNYRFKNYLVIIFLTGLAWGLYFYQMFFLARGLNLNASFIFLAVTTSMAALVSLIPISFYGLGTRDATLIFLFSQIGISQEKAIAFSTLVLTILLFNGMVGFIFLIFKKIKMV